MPSTAARTQITAHSPPSSCPVAPYQHPPPPPPPGTALAAAASSSSSARVRSSPLQLPTCTARYGTNHPQDWTHQPFTDEQHMQLRAQILVHADLREGKTPAEATMVRAFGEPVDDHKHVWKKPLRVAVDRLKNQRSPMTGLATPISSQIGSCAVEQGSCKDTAASKTIIAEPHSSQTHPNSSQHDGCEIASQGLNDDTMIQPVKKDPRHDELALQTAGISPSVSCDVAIQEDTSETNHPPVNTTEHTKMFEQQNSDEAYLEASHADKVNQKLYDDTVCGGQADLESHCCIVALHDKISEANSLSEKKTGKNMADTQKSCCSRSVPKSPRDGNEGGAKQASNTMENTVLEAHDKISEANSLSKKNARNNIAVIQKSCCGRSVPKSPRGGNEEGTKQTSNNNIMENTVAEMSHVHYSDDGFSGFAADDMPFCTEDNYTSRSIDDFTQRDLCVKCGKYGQLLKCSRCLLAAHASCFGPSVIFNDSGQFDCPVCLYNIATEAYKKAKEVYSEAWKNFSAFLGLKQLTNQHDEQYTGKQQRATNGNSHLNECNTSKSQSNQSKADSFCFSHKDEEAGQQKVNYTSGACPEEVDAGKASFGPNSGPAPMNKHSVLQNKRKQVRVADHELPMEKADTHEEYGKSNSSHVALHLSQNRCSHIANQNVKADKENGVMNSHICGVSGEIEATSWRNMGHHKVRFQEKGTVVADSFKKILECQDHHTPSLSSCNNPVTPTRRPLAPIRISLPPVRTPAASTVRRARLVWTKEEEAALREAVEKFAPENKGRTSWIRIHEYGRDVFHKGRRADDLRVKWKRMTKKKPCSCGFQGLDARL